MHMSKKLKSVLYGLEYIIVPVILLTIWVILEKRGSLNTVIMPAPSKILSTFLTMYALKYVPLTYSPIIEPLSYIFVPVIGVLVLKEKLSRRRVLGIVIMLAGIVIFSM